MKCDNTQTGAIYKTTHRLRDCWLFPTNKCSRKGLLYPYNIYTLMARDRQRTEWPMNKTEPRYAGVCTTSERRQTCEWLPTHSQRPLRNGIHTPPAGANIRAIIASIIQRFAQSDYMVCHTEMPSFRIRLAHDGARNLPDNVLWNTTGLASECIFDRRSNNRKRYSLHSKHVELFTRWRRPWAFN